MPLVIKHLTGSCTFTCNHDNCKSKVELALPPVQAISKIKELNWEVTSFDGDWIQYCCPNHRAKKRIGGKVK